MSKPSFMSLDDFLRSIPQNDFFLLRLLSAHYPFTNKELSDYASIIKWGSGVYTIGDDEWFLQYTNAIYGLCFNAKVNWSEIILAFGKVSDYADPTDSDAQRYIHYFEANSYQLTYFDEKKLPLSAAEESHGIVSASRSVYNSELSDKAQEIFFAHLDEWLDEVFSGPNKPFSFNHLSELVSFTNSCSKIYALNENLYNNLERLFIEAFGTGLNLVFKDLSSGKHGETR